MADVRRAPGDLGLRSTAPTPHSVAAGQPQAAVLAAGVSEAFDRVVLATHSDVSLRLRGPGATADETAVLAAIPYADNDVYLHRGAPLLWPPRYPHA